MTDWANEFARERSARIDFDTGVITDSETGDTFNSHEEWQGWVSQKRSQAIQKLLQNRDPFSDLENLPGTKETGHDIRQDQNW